MISFSFSASKRSMSEIISSVIFWTFSDWPRLYILADVAVLFGLLQAVHAVAADMADRDLALLGIIVRDLDQRLAALFVELRQRNAQVLAIDDRIEAEIQFADGTIDGADHRLVPDRNAEHARLPAR